MGFSLLFIFLLGLAVGSFLNVLILRLNTGMTLGGRSRCFSCLSKLQWYDLLPIISYLTIRGRCRYCKSKISLQYPAVEFFAGAIFVSAALFLNPVEEPLKYILSTVFFSILLAVSVYDLRHKIIPDQLSLALLLIALLFELIHLYPDFNKIELAYDVAAGVGAFLFFAIVWALSKGTWMGFGDAKLAFSLGLFLGYPEILLALLFAFWFGAVVGLVLLLLGLASRKTEVPFAPFLAFGSYISFLLSASGALLWYYNYVLVV